MKSIRISLLVTLLIGLLGLSAFAADVVEITMYGGFSEPEKSYYVLQKYLDEYQRLNPNVKVSNLGRVPDYDKLLAAMAGGTGPDIIKNGVTPMAEYFRQGLLLPVPDSLATKISDRMFPVVSSGVTFKNRMFGVPVENMLTGMMYNNVVLAQNGIGTVPETWDELVKVARKITQLKPDGSIDRPAVTLMDADWSLGFLFISTLLSQGGDLISSDGELTLESKEAERVLDLYLEAFTRSPYMNWDAWTPFHQGKIAFAFGFPFSAQWVHDINEFGSAPIPAGPGGYASAQYGHAYGVNVNSKHPAEAWRLLEWLSLHQGPSGVTALGETMAALGSMPLNMADIKSPLYRENWQFYEGFGKASENARSIMYYYQRGVTGEWRFGTAIKKVAFGNAQPAEVLRQITAEIESEMARMR